MTFDLPEEEGVVFKPFCASTLADAEAVCLAAYGEDCASRILRKILENPFARECGAESFGDIAYVGGKPVAMQAAIIRRMYDGQKSFSALTGSTLGAVPGTSPLVVLSLLKHSIMPRNGSRFWFANTANATAAKLDRLVGITADGGEKWRGFRFAIVNPWRFAWYLFVTRVLKRRVEWKDGQVKRAPERDYAKIDEFWRRYLDGNSGVVTSRSAAEVKWVFEDGFARGRNVFIPEEKDGKMFGYAILRNRTEGRWEVADLIALGNDPATVRLLLKKAKRFLRRNTNAIMLSIRGFPEDIQSVIADEFPHSRVNKKHLPFIYQPFDIPKGSWFFGPYDGDADL